MILFNNEHLAIVSGSTRGIGFAIAESLYKEGISVIINGRTSESISLAIKKLKSSNPNASGKLIPFVANLCDSNEVSRLYEAYPNIDIVVNNIGIYGAAEFEEITDNEWMKLFEINVMSGVILSRKYLPLMKDRGWGRIVFISSESAIQIPKEMIHYGMTKTAQLAISRGLAETCVNTGVTVNSILPGPTLTDGVKNFVKGLGGKSIEEFTEEYFETLRPSSIIKRFQSPEEIGDAVAFVCSERAASINGAAFRVDGGVVKACF
ncbi:SDR family NAD(P)-dependent oxidoreductase [Xenorhabdus thailandensis]|uniref:SDR family NAD(P)-dependent oxidoreductase n=1 Tax=Xenorhabdus thailandensis TaxID=3136255 RepID=UPI0030F49D32